MVGGTVLPSLLHLGFRYFSSGTDITSSRPRNALLRSSIYRGNNGRPHGNLSSLGADLAVSGLAEAYYPDSNLGVRLGFGSFVIGTGELMLSTMLQENVLRRLTPGARRAVTKIADEKYAQTVAVQTLLSEWQLKRVRP